MCEVSAGLHSDTKATIGYWRFKPHKPPFLVAAVLLKLSPNALPREMTEPSTMAGEIPVYIQGRAVHSPLEMLHKGKILK